MEQDGNRAIISVDSSRISSFGGAEIAGQQDVEHVTRVVDVVLSTIALLMLSVVFIPVMIILKFSGDRQIFFRQKRVGRGGHVFGLYKFTTMLRGSQHKGAGEITLKDDPRVFPFGKFLRKTKINELPQFINIFLGDMSFVGPRPQPRAHYEIYSQEVKEQMKKVRPGLTSIASIVFRDEESIINNSGMDHDEFYETKIAPYKGELESWYAKTRKNSLYNYCLIIALTAWVVWRPNSDIYKTLYKDFPKAPDYLEELLP
jgi:lipopolysaccharide/colanic/teichoic acid biosynthesis glycosyltransferase